MSVAHYQLDLLRKTPGTSIWHGSQWFDNLADFAAQPHAANICAALRDFPNYVPNRKNTETLRAYIASCVMPEDLQAALLAHLDAILGLQFKDEYKNHFSRSSGWRFMRDISAASCFMSSFAQAVNYER
jgi:hypothetical protein